MTRWVCFLPGYSDCSDLESSQDQRDGVETLSTRATSSTASAPKANDGQEVMPPSLHGPQFAAPALVRSVGLPSGKLFRTYLVDVSQCV
eukprot:6306168-Amphidinium_carterae.2